MLEGQTQLQRAQMERDSLQKQLRDIRDDSKRRIDALERRNLELEQDSRHLEHQLKSGETNKHKLHDFEEKARRLEMDLKHSEA